MDEGKTTSYIVANICVCRITTLAESPETGNPKIKPQKKDKSRFKSVLQPYASRNGVTQNAKTSAVHREIKYYPCKKYIAPKHSSSVSICSTGDRSCNAYSFIFLPLCCMQFFFSSALLFSILSKLFKTKNNTPNK